MEFPNALFIPLRFEVAGPAGSCSFDPVRMVALGRVAPCPLSLGSSYVPTGGAQFVAPSRLRGVGYEESVVRSPYSRLQHARLITKGGLRGVEFADALRGFTPLASRNQERRMRRSIPLRTARDDSPGQPPSCRHGGAFVRQRHPSGVGAPSPWQHASCVVFAPPKQTISLALQGLFADLQAERMHANLRSNP